MNVTRSLMTSAIQMSFRTKAALRHLQSGMIVNRDGFPAIHALRLSPVPHNRRATKPAPKGLPGTSPNLRRGNSSHVPSHINFLTKTNTRGSHTKTSIKNQGKYPAENSHISPGKRFYALPEFPFDRAEIFVLHSFPGTFVLDK
jgi:hypothetical protein